MFRPLALVPLALLLAACSPSVPMPTPTDTPSPSAFGQQAGLDWLVVATNGYLEASGSVCAWEDILTAPDPEFFGLYLERDPDSVTLEGTERVDNNGIHLQFDNGRYTASRFDGDIYVGIGTYWETSGTLTFERDAQGVIIGGGGTGQTRIIHESGDVERLPDTMTFTVSQFDEQTWCDEP